MGKTYSCQCKLTEPSSLSPEVYSATQKILKFQEEGLTTKEADGLADFIARHDKFFNERDWEYRDNEIVDRLQELDIPTEYSEAVKSYFGKNPASLARLTRAMNICTRARYVSAPMALAPAFAPVVGTVTSTITPAPVTTVTSTAVTPVVSVAPVVYPVTYAYPYTTTTYAYPTTTTYTTTTPAVTMTTPAVYTTCAAAPVCQTFLC